MSIDDRLQQDRLAARDLDVARLLAAIEVDGGPLRSAPTPVRRLGALAWWALLGAGIVFGQGARPFDGVLAAHTALLVALAAGGLWVGLRPLHRPALSAPWAGSALLLAVSATYALGRILPGLANTPTPPWPVHRWCFLVTLVGSLAAVGGAALVERGGARAPWRVALVSLAAGLAAFAFQTWVCPVVDPVHVAGAHAGPGLLVALVAGALTVKRGGRWS